MDGPVSTSVIYGYLLPTEMLYVVVTCENNNLKKRQTAILVLKNQPTFEHLRGAV